MRGRRLADVNWDSWTHMLMIGEGGNRFAVKFKLKNWVSWIMQEA